MGETSIRRPHRRRVEPVRKVRAALSVTLSAVTTLVKKARLPGGDGRGHRETSHYTQQISELHDAALSAKARKYVKDVPTSNMSLDSPLVGCSGCDLRAQVADGLDHKVSADSGGSSCGRDPLPLAAASDELRACKHESCSVTQSDMSALGPAISEPPNQTKTDMERSDPKRLLQGASVAADMHSPQKKETTSTSRTTDAAGINAIREDDERLLSKKSNLAHLEKISFSAISDEETSSERSEIRSRLPTAYSLRVESKTASRSGSTNSSSVTACAVSEASENGISKVFHKLPSASYDIEHGCSSEAQEKSEAYIDKNKAESARRRSSEQLRGTHRARKNAKRSLKKNAMRRSKASEPNDEMELDLRTLRVDDVAASDILIRSEGTTATDAFPSTTEFNPGTKYIREVLAFTRFGSPDRVRLSSISPKPGVRPGSRSPSLQSSPLMNATSPPSMGLADVLLSPRKHA